MVSIIMPAYQAAVTIAESIKSVLAQTFDDWEMIIVNDASTDNTTGIVEAYADKDSRIRLFTNETNQGVAATRNYGVSLAKGQYVAFLDSDDLWHEDKLKKQLHFMIENDAAISYTATAYLYEETLSNHVLAVKFKLSSHELLRHNLMSCSSVMVRRDVVAKYPFLSGDIHEDFVTWFNILGDVEFAYGLNEPLLTYRLSKQSKSGNRVKSGVMLFNSYKELGYGWFLCGIYMLQYFLYSVMKRVLIWVKM